MSRAPLPIDAALPELLAALSNATNVVLQAPPGAGKTTRVPLALLEASWAKSGRIVMLEPRRIAARAAAERLAETLGETVGGTVGYRIRDEAKVGCNTRIEVVTEGILARKLQGDPGLEGVAAVLFDEFHERSVHADLGLALCLDAQGALRPDLRLLVMSATLDGQAVSRLIGEDGRPAPIVTSEGRSYPVETRWLESPEKLGPRRRLEDATADLALKALAESDGDMLVFLPGAREIRGAASKLEGRVGAGVDILPLYGELPFAEQRRAIAPATPGRRKIVLATAIAETSLTIDGVRVVVDAGRSRRARFDPGSGMSRLVTERVSRAAAEQRKGRAGRTAPGLCYRLWTKGEEGGLRPFDPPEIQEADLAGLALELAEWGAAPEALRFLDPPPEAQYATALELLRELGAFDQSGGVSAHGRKIASAPLHPRLAHMALLAGGSETACRLAALLEERDPLRGSGVDLSARLKALAAPERHGPARGGLERINATARKLQKRLRAGKAERAYSLAELTALAYPDRIAERRPGDQPRFRLSGGKGAFLDEGDALAGQSWLAVADLDGDQREARIRLAAPIALSEIEALFADQIREVDLCEWSKRERKVVARRRRMLGAVVLADRIWKDAPEELATAALIEGVRSLGLDRLPWAPAAKRLRARIGFARAEAPQLPEVTDEALLGSLEDWLAPYLAGLRSAGDLAKVDLVSALESRLSWEDRQTLDRLCPARFTTPTGASAPIDYDGESPKAAVRVQMLFGLSAHPKVAGRPLLLELLSPAGRPIQTTADLPGFWAGSWADAAKEMRARYPKHPWPDDPANAQPTERAKPRKG